VILVDQVEASIVKALATLADIYGDDPDQVARQRASFTDMVRTAARVRLAGVS